MNGASRLVRRGRAGRGPQGQSPAQVRALLAAVETDQPELTAFFGCLYYAYLRPGEAVYLRKMDCVDLPSAGWGELLLTGNAPHAGAEWTDAGTTRDERQLKHRAQKTTRPVPIPPELVELIRRHMDHFGTTQDGRLFRAPRGGMLGESTYGRIWREARIKALTASQARSPLAGRPYDLRHSGVTLALNAGVPAPEVARRAGHGVEVLLRVYAGCIEGQAPLWNRRIDDALHDDETARGRESVSPWFRRQPSEARNSREPPDDIRDCQRAHRCRSSA